MAGIRLAALVRRLRRDTALESDLSADAVLVARYAATRDEAAFELLVRRHGAMVLAACRRILGHTEDAEDAFQAAFLVLARKAVSVRGSEVPAWLHRVAVRIARRAVARRRPMAVLATEPAARPVPDAAERAELRGLLDAEIDRLSEPFRRAFVLCYLEGLSNADAARVLGCPVGTIESRLAAARRTLRGRLVRRVELPAGTLALLACPPGLSADTVATLTRAGVTAAQRGLRATIGIVREPAVRLAEGGVRAMSKTFRVWAVVLGVSLLGLVAGVGWANRPDEPPAEPKSATDARPQPPAAPEPKPVDRPAAKDDAWPLVKQFDDNFGGELFGTTLDRKSLLIKADHSVWELSLVGGGPRPLRGRLQSQNQLSGAAVSPDGKSFATAEGENGVKLRDATGRVVENLWPKEDLPAVQVAFSPDGAKLIVLCSNARRSVQDGPTKTRVSVWDLATRKELGHPSWTDKEPWTDLEYRLVANGRFVLKTKVIYESGRLFKGRRYSVIDALSGKESSSIEKESTSQKAAQPDTLSPDGKTLVLHDHSSNALLFLDPATGKDRFRVPALRRTGQAVVFSPDGRFVAAATGKSEHAHSETFAAPSEVIIWDAATGRELARLTDNETIRDYSALAFSPDGSFLVARSKPKSSNQSTFMIWGRLPAPDPVPEPVAPVKPVKPVAKAPQGAPTPPSGAAPARFQALIGELSGADVTDARRIETLFVAALGRFPTDVEKRTLVAQFARREDKGTALADLLGTLVETTEFKAHLTELGRLAK